MSKGKLISARVEDQDYIRLKNQASKRGVDLSVLVREYCLETGNTTELYNKEIKDGLMMINIGMEGLEQLHSKNKDVQIIREGIEKLWQYLK